MPWWTVWIRAVQTMIIHSRINNYKLLWILLSLRSRIWKLSVVSSQRSSHLARRSYPTNYSSASCDWRSCLSSWSAVSWIGSSSSRSLNEREENMESEREVWPRKKKEKEKELRGKEMRGPRPWRKREKKIRKKWRNKWWRLKKNMSRVFAK